MHAHVRRGSAKRGMALIIIGLIPTVGGALATLVFLRRITSTAEKMSPGTVTVELILPHSLMVLGMGLVLYGLILLVRTRLMQARSEDTGPNDTTPDE